MEFHKEIAMEYCTHYITWNNSPVSSEEMLKKAAEDEYQHIKGDSHLVEGSVQYKSQKILHFTFMSTQNMLHIPV